MTRILSADILIADVIISLAEHPALGAFIEKYRLQPGGKTALDDAQLQEFLAATEGLHVTVTPGGSSANMLTTLGKLLGSEIDVRFFGITGEGSYSDIIRHSLDDAGITLLPDRLLPTQIKPQTAISFVFILPGGQCTIATHPGNARDILKPAMIAEHLLQNSDVLLAQGSLWHKLQPGFADRLYALCIKHGKQFWLTLPTQALLSDEEAENIRHVIPDAALVLGNEAELIRLYGAPLETALHSLQKALKGEALGFITFGKDGAAVVSSHGIKRFPPVPIAEQEIVNTLGAGDTAFAGFAAGYLKGLAPAVSAQIAMALAGAKLRVNGPRLADPRAFAPLLP